MQLTSDRFKETARAKLGDANLQIALNKLQANFVQGRAQRVAELDNFPAIRDAAAEIRDGLARAGWRAETPPSSPHHPIERS